MGRGREGGRGGVFRLFESSTIVRWDLFCIERGRNILIET